MIVVSDTTPLHYLILIDEVDLLPRLLGEIVIPEVVYHELQAEKTPRKIKNYFEVIPSWLSVRQTKRMIDPELQDIDPGEREAILLTEELSADGILIDDLAGRKIAVERGLRVIGTLGLLELAAEEGLVDFLATFDRITNAGFFVSRSLERELRSKHGGV